ncbi:MAG: VTT domain-containing protein [Acidobacteriota bacterium]|nr:VTT domain-containing protein [Acidobacteriota bacterium]
MKGLVEWLRALGPLGVFLLAILDGAGVPLVGGVDALLVWVAVTIPAAAYISAAAAIAGSTIGSVFLFLLARKGGETYLSRYTSTPRGTRLRNWFLEYGLLTAFVPALIPIPMPMKIFVLSAGAMGVRPWRFMIVVIAARIPRYFFLAWLGLQLGKETLPYLKHHVWQLCAVAAGLFVVLYLGIKFIDRRRKVSDSG